MKKLFYLGLFVLLQFPVQAQTESSKEAFYTAGFGIEYRSIHADYTNFIYDFLAYGLRATVALPKWEKRENYSHSWIQLVGTPFINLYPVNSDKFKLYVGVGCDLKYHNQVFKEHDQKHINSWTSSSLQFHAGVLLKMNDKMSICSELSNGASAFKMGVVLNPNTLNIQ